MKKVRQVSKRIAERIDPRIVAATEWVRPNTYMSPLGPMNGQAARRAMVVDVVTQMRPLAMVESGTYRGGTTGFLADISGVHVYSVEASLRWHTFARWLHGNRQQIHLHHGDSRSFLRRLAKDPSIPHERVMFYLDAHWNEDLPLAEELLIIQNSWEESAILIDDFEVPGDPEYGFDDYGPGATLTEPIIPVEMSAWQRMYPTTPAANETGAKRGCIVLAAPGLTILSAHLAPVE